MMHQDRDASWQDFVSFFRGFNQDTADIRPVKHYRVRKDMFTFPKGMQCWIAQDGHMYTLERPYHDNPRVIQMYVAPTLKKFSGRFEMFFEEMPILEGDLPDRGLDAGQKRLQ